MPSKSPAQARLMAGAANNPKFAKKVGVPQSVGKEFNQADRQRAQAKALRQKKPKPAYDADADGM